MVLVFQKGVGAHLLGLTQVDTIEAWVPLFLFSLLFGLSMDYQVFLLSRIKERFDHTGDTREAVAYGVGRTAGIITGAAAIMVCVFAGMAGGQLVMFQQMGFGLAVAVLIDATVVRTIIVPAAMELLGDWNWYLPRWLEWLPNVSVEGHISGRRMRGRDAAPRRDRPAPGEGEPRRLGPGMATPPDAGAGIGLRGPHSRRWRGRRRDSAAAPARAPTKSLGEPGARRSHAGLRRTGEVPWRLRRCRWRAGWRRRSSAPRSGRRRPRSPGSRGGCGRPSSRAAGRRRRAGWRRR